MKQDECKQLDKEVVAQLKKRSDYKGLIQLVGHLLVLLALGITLAQAWNTLLVLPALLAYAIVLTFLFAPLHETIHYTAFKSRNLNNLVAASIGFLQLLPYQYFRSFHYGHHRHTQDPKFDPELQGKKAYTRSSLLWHITGLPLWGSNIRAIFRHATGVVDESHIEQRDHQKIISEARWHLGGYLAIIVLSLLSSNAWAWWYWVLPSLVGQPFLRLFLLAEHNGCDFSNNMLENSRTTYTSPLVNFLAWNMPFHAEHHYLASVPFHALPALHALTGQQVKYKGQGYWQVNREISSQIE
jgi:fatty acid desaturase